MSLNSLIWNRCPKHRHKGAKSIQTAAGSAVLQYNYGATARHSVMRSLSIPSGEFTESGSARKNKIRIQTSRSRAQEKSRRARQIKRQAKIREEERLKNLEGETYGAGAFNEDNLAPSTPKRRRLNKK